MALGQVLPTPASESLWAKWLTGSTSVLMRVGACLGGIFGFYQGIANWGLIAGLLLGSIGVVIGGIVGLAISMLFSMGLLLVAVLVPVVLVIALLIYAFSN